MVYLDFSHKEAAALFNPFSIKLRYWLITAAMMWLSESSHHSDPFSVSYIPFQHIL